MLLTVAAVSSLLVLAPAGSASAAVSVSAMKTWQVHGTVYAIAYAGPDVYVGGSFDSVLGPRGTTDSQPRSNAAAFDVATGAPLNWSPPIVGTVRAVAVSPDGTTVYLGGSFSATTPDGLTQKFLVAVSASTGQLLNWHPRLTADVRALAVSPDGSRLYVGGSFNKADGLPRLHLAAYNTASGTLDLTWAPNPDGTDTYNGGTLQAPRVNALALSPDGTTLYVGGVFTMIGGEPRNNGAAVDTFTGLATGFSPSPALKYVVLVTRLSSDGSTVYFGGRGPGGFLGGYATTTSSATYPGEQLWYRRFDGDVQAAAVHDSLVYVGGHFQNVYDTSGGTQTPCAHLAALDTATGTLDGWNAQANSSLGVFALDAEPGYLGAGGMFTKIDGLQQQGFAEFAG